MDRNSLKGKLPRNMHQTLAVKMLPKYGDVFRSMKSMFVHSSGFDSFHVVSSISHMSVHVNMRPFHVLLCMWPLTNKSQEESDYTQPVATDKGACFICMNADVSECVRMPSFEPYNHHTSVHANAPCNNDMAPPTHLPV